MTREQVYGLIEQHYRKRHSMLVSTYASSFGNKDDAEESVQEAYTRALTYWHTFKDNMSIDNWIGSILDNCNRDKWRDKINDGMKVDGLSQDEPSIRMEGEFTVELAEVREMVLDEKPDNQTIINLHLFDGLTATEIEGMVPNKRQSIWRVLRQFDERVKKRFKL